MGESTYTRGELTIPAAAIDAWSRELDIAADDAAETLVGRLTELVTEDIYEPISTHRTDDGLHAELYGDYRSSSLGTLLGELGRAGATGRVWFPEDGMWGYTLTPAGAIEQDGAQLYPGDELLLLTIDLPGRARHRAFYAHPDNARLAADQLYAAWSGGEHRSTDLDAALAAICTAGGTATCQALPFAS